MCSCPGTKYKVQRRELGTGARTKSELLLARLRRSWHIRLQWNSCGCRRRLRPARPTLKKSRSFQSGPRRPRSSPSLVRRRREPQKAADYATRGASASRECLVERWIASLRSQRRGTVPPGFLCRILGRRRALRQARTKSELLLARLRRSWHIRLQWNSCGCRRRLRPARPTLKKSRSFQSGPRPPRSSPSLVPRCREPQKAADYATSGASASRECLVERWIASLRSQ